MAFSVASSSKESRKKSQNHHLMVEKVRSLTNVSCARKVPSECVNAKGNYSRVVKIEPDKYSPEILKKLYATDNDLEGPQGYPDNTFNQNMP